MKKLLLTTLAIPLLAQTAYAEDYYYDYEEEKISSIEAPYSEASITSGDAFATGEFRFGDDRWGEEPQFENNIDRAFFRQFGPSFNALKRNAIAVNQTATYGNIQMDILYSVAIADRVRTHEVWDFNEETEEFEPTGEMQTWRNFNTFTLFTLQDETKSEEDFLGIALNFNNSSTWTDAQFLFFDAETSTAYFMANQQDHTEEELDTIEVNLSINQIFSDLHSEMIEADVNISYLLENHNATFVTSEELGETQWPRSFGVSHEAIELFGEDFDPSEDDFLKRDELNLSLGYDIFLSNIALVENLLHIQLNESSGHFLPGTNWRTVPSVHASLVNTSIEEINWDEIDAEAIEDWEAFWRETPQRHMHWLYGRSASEYEEYEMEWDGEYFTTFREVDDRRYGERAYHIADLSILEYLALELSVNYFRNQTAVALTTETFTVDVMSGSIVVAEEISINIEGRNYTIRDLTIGVLGISFDVVDGMQTLSNFDAPAPSRFSPIDDIEIIFTLVDGEELTPLFNGASWGGGMDDLFVSLSGAAIDVENVQSITINGVTVNLR